MEVEDKVRYPWIDEIVTIVRIGEIKNEYSEWNTVYVVRTEDGREFLVGDGQIESMD